MILKVNAVRDNVTKLVALYSNLVEAIIKNETHDRVPFEKCVDSDGWLSFSTKMMRVKGVESSKVGSVTSMGDQSYMQGLTQDFTNPSQSLLATHVDTEPNNSFGTVKTIS